VIQELILIEGGVLRFKMIWFELSFAEARALLIKLKGLSLDLKIGPIAINLL
jgi:hypothetical protein